MAQIVEGMTKIKAPQDLDKRTRKEIKSSISTNLDILSQVIKKLEPAPAGTTDHFLIPVLNELWPLLESVMDYYYDSTEIMEASCKLVRRVMECLKHHFSTFLERYFTVITKNYERYPLATYLYSVENALTIYYTQEGFSQMLAQLYAHMIMKTQKHLKSADPKKEDPDLIDDFFGLITRYLRRLPQVVVACEPEVAEGQFQVAIQTIGITMEGPVKALYQYFDEVFCLFDAEKVLPGKEVFLQVFTSKGYAAAAVSKTIDFMVNECPDRYLLKFFYDFFYSILKYSRQASIPWFVQALQTQVPSNVLTNPEKQAFVQALETKDFFEHKEYYSEFLGEFFARCRNNSSTKH